MARKLLTFIASVEVRCMDRVHENVLRAKSRCFIKDAMTGN